MVLCDSCPTPWQGHLEPSGPPPPRAPPSQARRVPSRASPGARRVCPFLADRGACLRHTASTQRPPRPQGSSPAVLVSRGGLGGWGAGPGAMAVPTHPSASLLGVCSPPASSSFPCSPGHNEQPRGVPAVALPQAGWSRPSFPLTSASHGLAGGQASCSPGPSLHASGHGVTSKCSRGARAPLPCSQTEGLPLRRLQGGHKGPATWARLTALPPGPSAHRPCWNQPVGVLTPPPE